MSAEDRQAHPLEAGEPPVSRGSARGECCRVNGISAPHRECPVDLFQMLSHGKTPFGLREASLLAFRLRPPAVRIEVAFDLLVLLLRDLAPCVASSENLTRRLPAGIAATE
jgi:hypothetical protein